MARTSDSTAVTPATRRVMQGNKAKNSKPEMRVRRVLHGLGYRYRLHRKGLPGRPDVVFAGRRKAIFVHGCFWHAHGCAVGNSTIKTRIAFWAAKFDRNKARDARVEDALLALGWNVLVIWECQTHDLDTLRQALASFLGPTAQKVV